MWNSFASDDSVDQDFQSRDPQDRPGPEIYATHRELDVLELGAGAGLPGIVIAKYLALRRTTMNIDRISVTLSDYPDHHLIRTLEDNVSRNAVDRTCYVVPYAWGTHKHINWSMVKRYHSLIVIDGFFHPITRFEMIRSHLEEA